MVRDEHLLHGKLFSFGRDFRHAEGVSAVPLVASELANVCHEVPVLFEKRAGGWQVQGLLADPNLRRPLLTAGGRWRGGYAPFHLRVHPFRLTPDEQGWEVDGTALGFPPGRGHPFFLANGRPSAPYARVLASLADADEGRRILARLAGVLEEAGLLVPIALGFELHAVTPTLSGLFCVDALRLPALPRPELALLVAGAPSALDLAFASIYSLRLLRGVYAGRDSEALDARFADLIRGTAQVRAGANNADARSQPDAQDHVAEPQDDVLLGGFALDQSSGIDFGGLFR